MDLKRPSTRKSWLKKAALGFSVVLVVVSIGGFVVQRQRDKNTRATHPPPGSFVMVDGHRFHYRVRGDGDFTFVLEPGLGDYSGDWRTLESSLATMGRVFVYDRAGLGWSDESVDPRTPERIATELHCVLEAAQIQKPYLLVGHSLGGLTHTLYAMLYRDDVMGLLLIDPSHKDQFQRLPGPPALFATIMPQLPRMAPLGLPQLLFGSSDPVKNQTAHIQTAGAELRAVLNVAETWGNRPVDLGNLPIYVLTAGDHTHFPGKTDDDRKAAWEIWKSLHAELVAASSSEVRKHQVVAGGSHYLHQTHPEVVIAAAKDLVDRIKFPNP